MRIPSLIALSLAALLVGCAERDDSPIQTSSAGAVDPTNPVALPSAPPAEPDRGTPPAPTPATHDMDPQQVSAPAPTARDTPAQKPAGEMTKSEEQHSQPKPGQTDNHFTTSTEGALKGTQQSDGTPPLQPPAGSAGAAAPK
jgi:hypothetical protein